MPNEPDTRPPHDGPTAAPDPAPRHILVAGAAGRTGRLLVGEALARGHTVTAFVRDPSRLRIRDVGLERLRVVAGDARVPGDVAPSLSGQDAVISLLSHASAPVVDIFSAGTRVLADAAERAGVRRFVAVSASPVGVDPARLPLTVRAVMLIPHLDVVYEDMARMERDLMSRDGLDWTIVRPAVLTDLPGGGRFRVATGEVVPGGVTTSRADLAGFLVRLVETGKHVRERVAIAD
jgi:putative NADH-flavin reductase